MCGIVGFITDESGSGSYARRRWFTNALLTNTVRGDDGTGVFLVTHKNEGGADWAKLGDDASAFLRTEAATERLSAQAPWNKYRSVIGHNRSATVGGVSTKNAHPFQEGPITLVHNGTLTSTYGLPKGRSNLKDVDVDSHVITHNLATHDAEEVIGKLDGAFVLVWHDSRDQSINIVRNSERPLHLMPVSCEKTILIASEAEMLWWLVKRSTDFRAGPIFYPEPGHWMKFVPDQGITPIVKQVELYTPKWGRRGYGRGYGGWGGYDDDDYGAYYGQVGASSLPKAQAVGPKEPDAPRPPALPKVLASTLTDVQLLPTDKLRFLPTTVAPIYGTKYANVIGRCVDLNKTGVIQGLVWEAVAKCAENGEMWTVYPVASKATEGTGNVLILRLSRRTVTHRTDPVPSSTSSSDEKKNESGYTNDNLYQYLGPDLTMLNKSQWDELVADGCAVCGCVIEDHMAEELEWDTDDAKPICPECVMEMMEDEVPGASDDINKEEAPWCAGE